MMALSSSRLAYLGGRPVALRWGRSGSILAHCSSVRSVGYSLLGVVGVFISVSIFFLPVSGHPLSEAKNHWGKEYVRIPSTISCVVILRFAQNDKLWRAHYPVGYPF